MNILLGTTIFCRQNDLLFAYQLHLVRRPPLCEKPNLQNRERGSKLLSAELFIVDQTKSFNNNHTLKRERHGAFLLAARLISGYVKSP